MVNVLGLVLIRHIHTVIFSPYFSPTILYFFLFFFPLFILSLTFNIFLYLLVRDALPAGDIFLLFLRA